MAGVHDSVAVPRGRLVRSRVVSDVGRVLADALDHELTGYVVLEPGDSLLLDGGDRGLLTFEDGVPVLAYHAGTDVGGTDAVETLAGPGPWRFDWYELDAHLLEVAHETSDLRVPPGMPADRLAGDPVLADRTRERAPDGVVETAPDALAAFLDDEERIDAIRRDARQEARAQAAEWGLDDQLVDE